MLRRLLPLLSLPFLLGLSYSEESGGSLTTSYVKLTLDGAHSGIVPQRKIKIGLVTCSVSSISGATSVTWYLSTDSAGDKPITPAKTTAIVVAQSANAGGFSETVDAGVVTDATAIYVWAKLDAGTATAGLCRAFWEAA